jgi:flagellar basal body rod protein FlgB
VDELVLMQQNSILYSVAAKNMSSTITMMKNAINVGQG